MRSGAPAVLLSLALGLVPSVRGATLVVANKTDDTVDLIDVADGHSRATLATGHAPHEVAVSTSGTTAVVSNYGDRAEAGSSLTVVDVVEGKVLRTIDLGQHHRPHGLAWISERSVVVTAEGSAHLLVVDIVDGSITTAIKTGQEILERRVVLLALNRGMCRAPQPHGDGQ